MTMEEIKGGQPIGSLLSSNVRLAQPLWTNTSDPVMLFLPAGQFHESPEGEDRIVVPQGGRPTKVPVSSVLI